MFINLSKTPQSEVQLICFPFAGSGASLFYPWVHSLSPKFEIWAFQAPGHEELVDQELINDLVKMKEYILQKILPILKPPFILFGHSLGAVLAYELTKELQSKNLIPATLIVSGRQPPHLKSKKASISHLKNEDFINEVFQFNGTPQELLASNEFLEMAIPILRADFQLAENYQVQIQEKIKCPIKVLGSTHDQWIDVHEITQWSDATENSCEIAIFEGDHFHLKQNPKVITSYLNGVLRAAQSNE
jgi:medium-chain acyl-[acyl-carrier-protein] hydrolase